MTRDIIVIGASFGGIEALKLLAAGMPADLTATILVVQHTSERSPGLLADILAANGPLPAVMATDRMPLRPGSIIVARPGNHLLLTRDGIRVVFGPRENLSRPAIDPLFRSAAVNYGSRVIGVVLTGLLGDGSVGLHAIDRCGGVAVVQHPDEAVAPDMPRRALALVPHALAAGVADIPALLSRLTSELAPPSPPVPESLQLEAAVTERAMTNNEPTESPGQPTDFTCPDCSGALHVIEDDGVRRYRCRVGHAYAPDAMLIAKGDALEDSLWVALQTMKERAEMLNALARDEAQRGRLESAEAFERRAAETREHAERLRTLIQQIVV